MNIKDCKGINMNMNDCKGCLSRQYRGLYILCNIIYKQSPIEIDIPICPCVECLIKMVCREICSTYLRYNEDALPTAYKY
jgi:hypothetical protein